MRVLISHQTFIDILWKFLFVSALTFSLLLAITILHFDFSHIFAQTASNENNAKKIKTEENRKNEHKNGVNGSQMKVPFLTFFLLSLSTSANKKILFNATKLHGSSERNVF